jgi:uncharacterized protein (TIGR03083 family)
MELDDEIRAYDASRKRITELVLAASPEQRDLGVPCCPAWTVGDLIGHLVGLVEDREAGRMPTGPFDAWTAEQVARHRGDALDEVLDQWGTMELARSDAPPSLAALSFDVVTHEHDLFEALGVAGDTATTSVHVGAKRARDRMAAQLKAGDAPGVVLRTEGGEVELDGDGRRVELATSEFGLLRLVTGRMSERQARGLAWDGDPSEVLGALFADGFFTLQPTDVASPSL